MTLFLTSSPSGCPFEPGPDIPVLDTRNHFVANLRAVWPDHAVLGLAIAADPAAYEQNDELSREFAHTRRKNLLLRDLDELVNQQLAKMLFANPQRIDYYDRYQEIIDAYIAEQNRATIEKTFMDLMELASSLDTEQQRYVREGFSSDEELSVYDLLFSENLTKQEIETIKKVSVDLLIKIKQQIAKLDHWTDKQETKAIVDNLIRNTLWQELPNSYDVSDIQTYQKKIYEYVYMRYPEVA